MRPTLIYIHTLASDHLEALGNRETFHDISDFIRRLGSDPTLLGDYAQPDPRGRMMEVKLIGRQAVIYFKDPFANLVKILEIRNIEAA
ncbi:MAG: hypothetical protein ACSHX0_06635 [Akkermansiaceae bacterium]